MLEYQEVHLLDRNSEYFGTPQSELMENAGKGAFEVLNKNFDLQDKNICILVGKGNNGGDGLVLARFLIAESKKVTVYMLYDRDECSELNKANYDRIPKSVNILDKTSVDDLGSLLKNSDIIIDAMLGIGISSEPRDPIKGIIKVLNHLFTDSEIELKPIDRELSSEKKTDEGKRDGSKTSAITEEDASSSPREKQIVSLDVPSGLGTRIFVRPNMTITFHDVKKGMVESKCGKIIKTEIGIPPEALEYVGPGEFVYFRENSSDSHKGQNGVVLVIGGGPYVGAPVLASMAALRSGADLVHLFVPPGIFVPASSYYPDVITHSMDTDSANNGFYLDMKGAKQCREFSKECDAVVIGPGLGRNPETIKAVFYFLHWIKVPLVIDADALLSLKNQTHVLRYLDVVLTPHQGEFNSIFGSSRLTNDLEPMMSTVRRKAGMIRSTILLKGSTDIISDGATIKLNSAGHPSMTTGGTGDVLAGIVGALMARGLSPLRAANLAAFINGKAGETASESKGMGLCGSDLLDAIPAVFTRYL